MGRLKLMTMAAGFAVMLAGVAQAQTPPYQLTLAGASPGGLWSSIGLGLDKAMKAAYPGSTITYQTSGGGIANVQLLEKKTVPLGIVHNMELRMAQNGEAPFKSKVEDLRVIAYLYNWAPVQLILTKEFADKYGIKTFEDIAVKKPPLRVASNRRGNVVHEVVDRMFKAIGVTEKDIEKWGGSVIPAASKEQGDLLRNRRIDGFFNSLFVGQRSILEVAHAVDVVMLPVSDATIKKVTEETGTDRFVIPAKSYAFQPDATAAVSLGAMLVVNKSMSDQEAYNIAKAMVEHVKEMQSVHPAMKALTPKFMTEQKAGQFHPGAAKLYKEKGLL
jgi:TRAP transporter TAXI family solute receptor